MGHSKASKAATHERIVKAAAERFKERGVDGIGLAELMKELDLTHGGFYKHFASREQLVAEALQLALTDSGRSMRERLTEGGKSNVVGFVNFYLGEAHRAARANGCVVAALAGDAARESPEIQAQFREQIDQNLDVLSAALEPKSQDARAEAIFVLSALYGALTMARAVGDSPLAREVLRTVRKRLLK
jgi:TetR/AcrR family transcriptional regulator, transcriptional repressor for nem operon